MPASTRWVYRSCLAICALTAPCLALRPHRPIAHRIARPAAAVSDLAVAATPYGGVALTWTAVGDDGGGPGQCTGAGRATSYDLRYSPIAPGGDLNAWFNGATQATAEPSPLQCGSAESMCIPGLQPGVTLLPGAEGQG
jgi:hypothetical protein